MSKLKLGSILYQEPISDVIIEIAPEYEQVCKQWLNENSCTLSHLQEDLYRVDFPANTVVVDKLGASGVYTRRRHIILPSSVEIPLIIASAINETQHTRTTLEFPQKIFPD